MKNQKVIREKVTKENATDLHSRLSEALSNFEKSKFDVAVAFYEAYTVRENGLFVYQKMGYNSFREYVETEFAFEYRNAMYYVQIGKAITNLGINKNEIDEVGWSKFKELTSILLNDLDRNTFDKIKNSVKNMTVRELKDFIEEHSTETIETATEKVKKCKLTFSLTNEQINIVKEALNKATEKYQLENENLALEAICADFLSGE